MSTSIRPSRWMYLIPVGIFLLGLIIATVIFFRLGSNILNSTTFNLGENVTITAEAGDKMLIGLDNYGNSDVDVTTTALSTELYIGAETITLGHDDSINVVEIEDNTTMTIMEYNMVIALEFTESGTFDISTDSDIVFTPDINFMLLPIGIQGILISTLSAVVVIGFSFILALVVGILIKVKRNSSKKKTLQDNQNNNTERHNQSTTEYYE